MDSEMTITPPPDQITLYSFYASSCGQRIVIAAALKGLAVQYVPISMKDKEHRTASFLALNPSGALPVLEVSRSNGTRFVLAQTIAILEYLEEVYPGQLPLLPKGANDRAIVRQMVGVMVCDAFPPSNSRVSQKVRAIRNSEEDQDEFVREINLEAFLSYEGLLEQYGGSYSFGDTITLADVCLIPQVDLAKQYGFDLNGHSLRRTMKVIERLMEMPEFKYSGRRHQIDTPEKLRIM